MTSQFSSKQYSETITFWLGFFLKHSDDCKQRCQSWCFLRWFAYHHIQGKSVSNRFVKQPSDTLPDEEPPPFMSKWPRHWVLLKTDWSKGAVEGYKGREQKSFTQIKDGVFVSKCITHRKMSFKIYIMMDREHYEYICHWYQKGGSFLKGKDQTTIHCHMPKVQRSAFQEMVFKAFQMLLTHSEWFFLVKKSPRR